jgi:hypothetical protein
MADPDTRWRHITAAQARDNLYLVAPDHGTAEGHTERKA